MPVTCDYNTKLGEVTVVREFELNSGETEVVVNKKPIYGGGNCLAVVVNEWQEKQTTMRSFYTFFNDIHSLKRCIGLEPYNKYDSKQQVIVKTRENIYANEWKEIKLNTFYPESMKMTKYFVQAGFKVNLYYEKPAKL